MARTYKAILRGDRIEWVDAPPAAVQPTPVQVTVMDEAAEIPERRGHEMAQALEALAKTGGLSDISDPVEWQRELRRDRSLPGRES
jgi:hypothetical protein